MKKNVQNRLRSILLSIGLLLATTSSYASHILGADLFYTWVSGNTYKITVILYGDCSPASASAFSSLTSASPMVCIYRGANYVTSINLNFQGPGVDITPVCPPDVGNTQCENTASTIPGIMRFIYTGNYTLPAPTTSNCWQFAYFGQNNNGTISGRTGTITNLVNPGATYLQLIDTLNNTVSPHNSNAQFSVIPMPFFCLNNADTYNPGTVDPDLDSLRIDLIPAKDAANPPGGIINNCGFGVPINYTGTAWTPPATPVSATTPLNVQAGTFVFNSQTGQLDFVPSQTQRSTVVYNVREFRGGNFVGSCQREMNFLVLTCTNPPPIGGIDSVNTGTMDDSTHFHICNNAGPFNLYFDPRESITANNITVTSSGLPVGATINVAANGTNHPHVTFSWTSNGIAPGSYIFYLTYTDNNCPIVGTNTVAITVTITPYTAVTYTVVSPATCVAKAVISVVPVGTGAPWTIDVRGTTPQTFTGVTGPFTDSLPPGVDTFFITPSSPSPCTAITPIVIPGPLVITIGYINPTVCAPGNGSFTLSGLKPGYTYNVYFTENGTPTTMVFVADASGTIVVNGLLPGIYTGVYAYEVTTGCSSNILNFTLTNATTPVPPDLSSNAPICADSTLFLFAADTAVGIAYSWTGPNGFTSTMQNPVIVNAQTAASGIYRATVTRITTGCNSSATLNVIVKPTPKIPVVTGNNPCDGGTLSLGAASDAGATYTWTGPSGFNSTLQNPVLAPANSSHAGTYSVFAMLNGCPSLAGTGTYTVYPIPPAPIGVDSTYCQHSATLPLTAAGSNLLWYSAATGGAGTPIAPVPSDSAVGTVTWYVTQTVNGCESPRTAINTTILYLPVFSIAGNSPICPGDSLTLSYSGPVLNAPGYLWTIPVGASIVSGGSTGDFIIVRFDSTLNQYVTLTASDYNGRCFSKESIHVDVLVLPKAQLYIKPDICKDDTVVVALSYIVPTAISFRWDFAGADTIAYNSNSGGPYSLSWHDTGKHTISVIAVNSLGCASPPVFDSFNVHGFPDARIAPMASAICLEDTVVFSAMFNQYNALYTWAPEHFFNYASRPLSNNNAVIEGIIEHKGYVTLTVTDPFGCRSSDSLYFAPDPCCDLAFPNAFSPNGDTRNDVFRPIFKGYHRFHVFRIVNRWGQTVFETTNSLGAWDGNVNGVPQDIGVYFYYIKYDCGGNTFEMKGDVTLVR